MTKHILDLEKTVDMKKKRNIHKASVIWTAFLFHITLFSLLSSLIIFYCFYSVNNSKSKAYVFIFVIYLHVGAWIYQFHKNIFVHMYYNNNNNIRLTTVKILESLQISWSCQWLHCICYTKATYNYEFRVFLLDWLPTMPSWPCYLIIAGGKKR